MTESANGPIGGGDEGEASRLADATAPLARVTLTPRERQFLVLLTAGYTNEEIGALLHLGTQTVKNRVSVLIDKLGAKNRVQLAVYAVKNGLSE
ncbi:MAG TPA: LuxR C-terminal-related transcriptional regulator [Vicinamibacterales bacterium]|jgi:DNA-binding NarL/FixJ family response regulator|nr:LuxR C-terminal-related transcriptional regulator [Vicinamibacterales bacterium]